MLRLLVQQWKKNGDKSGWLIIVYNKWTHKKMMMSLVGSLSSFATMQ